MKKELENVFSVFPMLESGRKVEIYTTFPLSRQKHFPASAEIWNKKNMKKISEKKIERSAELKHFLLECAFDDSRRNGLRRKPKTNKAKAKIK